jgi:catechol 2,3-dioxygenase-like lactoylglutathione lyase family enzyme
MIKVRRIGHATFETPDIDRQIDHYTQVVGLTLAAREKDRAFLATKTGQLVLQLERAGAPRIARIAFEVSANDDFTTLAKRLSEDGIKSEQRSDTTPGTPKILAFEDIKGTTIELFSEWAFLGRDQPVQGVGPLKLGHLAMAVPDPQAVSDYYCRVLGFRVSDWVEDYFAFLRCGPDHHTVNFVRGNSVRFHHIAFELKDFSHVQGACEWLGRKKVDIIWGPGRHGAGHNVFIYHRNPDDQVVEFYTELDKMLDEELGYFDPKPWHVDQPQRPKVWDRKSAGLVWGPPPTPDFLRGRDAPAPV